jgi:hypothetical protein
VPQERRGGVVEEPVEVAHDAVDVSGVDGARLPDDMQQAGEGQRWAQDVGVSQFGVFPLVVFGKVIGSILIARGQSDSVPDRATIRFAQAVVDLVVEAIARRRFS